MTLLTETTVFTGRSVRRLVRTPETVVTTAAFPAVLLLTLSAVFGTAVEGVTGGDYAQRLVPALVVSGVMFGSSGAAVTLFVERRSGLQERLRTLPISAVGPLVGLVAAEAVRALVAVVGVGLVGAALGFRFHGGPLDAAVFVLVAALAACSMLWIGVALATVATSQEAIGPPLNGLFLVLLFFSGGIVPVDAYPGWARPLVEANPATAYVDTLDGAARGHLAGTDLATALAWSAGLVVVFAGLALAGNRRRG